MNENRNMNRTYTRRRVLHGGIVAGLLAGTAGHRQGVFPGNPAVAAPDFLKRPAMQASSRIRMYVYITNETEHTLSLTSRELESGEFTDDWYPPGVIQPGQRVGFQGEGDLFLTGTTGTEGRVRYNIDADDGGELYIHWNSPLIESQYGNTFHIWAPPGWEVTHSGGQGHRAELEIRLRRTGLRAVPDFHPHGRGIPFLNDWSADLGAVYIGQVINALFALEPGVLGELGVEPVDDQAFGPITHADTGFCGGMVFTVMDYHANHLLPTTMTMSPTDESDLVYQHCRDRLWDSFDVHGQGHRYLGYSSPLYPNGDEGVSQTAGLARGRSWVTYRDAMSDIQADIDAGRLSPLGLIRSDELDIGQNHQVLAWAYEKSGQDVTLHIYDPNEGQKDVTFKFNITATDGEVHIERFVEGTLNNDKRIFCIFRTNGYVAKMPPMGRPFTDSVTDTIRAVTSQNPPYSLRAAMAGRGTNGSVTDWLRSF
jgi:hypothetical protein